VTLVKFVKKVTLVKKSKEESLSWD